MWKNKNFIPLDTEHCDVHTVEEGEAADFIVEGSSPALTSGMSMQTNGHSTSLLFEQQVLQQNQQYQASLQQTIKGIIDLSSVPSNLKGSNLHHRTQLAYSSLNMLELEALLKNTQRH